MNRGSYDIDAGNLYPGTGPTTGARAGATTRFGSRGTTATTAAAIAPDAGGDEVSKAAAVGRTGNPLIAIGIGIAIVVAFWWGSHRLLGGEGSTAGDLRLSFHNALIILFVAFFGLPLAKILLTKIKVPGLSTVALMGG